MKFVVEVAWHGKDTKEKYREFIVEGTWDTIPEPITKKLKKGERIIKISEGGYQ